MTDALHILPSIDNRHAGLSAAVVGLASAQCGIGLAAEVLPADRFHPGCRSRGLLAEARSSLPNIIHSHGLWLSPSRASRWWRRSGGATVVAPHGMLDPWAWRRHYRLKQLLWSLGEAETLGNAACLQALCAAEAEGLRAMGLGTPIAVIPNGVARPDRHRDLPSPPWAGRIEAGTPVLLFLGRFHRKKGLEVLLQAWTSLQERRGGVSGSGDWWLVFIGFGDGGELVRRLERDPLRHCLALDAVFGRERDSAYAHAGGFILPSFSEGLPLAALEAMSWGLPCLLSSHCNLPEAFRRGAAWPADPVPGDLNAQLRRFCNATVDERREMAQAAEALVEDHYSWSGVAARSRALYQWLLGGGESPACLHPPL